MEPLPHRQLLRIASLIVDKLAAVHAARPRLILQRLNNVLSDVERLRTLSRQLDMATSRQWLAAAGRLLDTAPHATINLSYNCTELEHAIGAVRPQAVMLRDVLAELHQCQDEFGQLKYEPKGSTLSIITDPIELEDQYLGEFQIELDLGRMAEARHNVYQVIALDPHPASCNDSVTHLHVSDGRLCEGDAGAAIGAALATGRTFDFLSLVKSVLGTYNASSPYVNLNDWDGESCFERGTLTSTRRASISHVVTHA